LNKNPIHVSGTGIENKIPERKARTKICNLTGKKIFIC